MIRLGGDTLFKWTGMTNSLTGDYVNNATVACVVKSLSGTQLATFSMTYLSGTNGNYAGVLPAASVANLEECTEYLVEITATSGGSTEFRRERHNAEYGGY